MNGGGEGLTLFARLDDNEDNDTTSTNTGILGGFFRGWFKQQQQENDRVDNGEGIGNNTVIDTNSVQSNDNEIKDKESPNGSNTSDEQRKISSTSSRVSTLFGKSGDGGGLIDYNRSDHRQYWMPDSTGRICYQCEVKFNTMRRKHHCRLCGRIFCSKCCSHRVNGSLFGYSGELRLCNYCVRTVHQYLPSNNDGIDGNINGEVGSINQSMPSTSMYNTNHQPISTVSGGGLHWSESASTSWDQNRPQNSKTQLLSVADLCELQDGREERRNSHAEHSQGEEEESGPEWVRSMDMTKGGGGNNNGWNGTSNRSSDNDSINISINGGPVSPSKNNLIKTIPIDSTDREVKARKVLGDDTDVAFEKKSERLLEYLFKREGIDKDRWYDIILRTSRSMASIVKVDVKRRRDNMNILEYIHIKKLPTEEDVVHAEIVQGVVCRQSVTHTDAMMEMRDASVMLVAGSIEYERGPGRLATLEPILAQENEYLARQVERILARRPSVLLVEKGASRTAVELLHKNGVRTIVNVKQSVLRRVGRSTGADILPSSDAQLIQQNIGFCPVFSQRLVRLRNGNRKSIVIFDECQPDKGCSILLYSSSLKELVAVKKVLQSMILLLYSMDLEKSYLRLFNVRLEYRSSGCEVCETRRLNIDHDGHKSGLEQALDNAILSVSPFIDVEPPFLETTKGRSCSLLEYFKQPLYPYMNEEEIGMRRVNESIDEKMNMMMNDQERSSSCNRSSFSLNTRINNEDDISLFRAKGGILFRERIKEEKKNRMALNSSQSSPRSHKSDVLDPLQHQRVAVLFGSFSPKSPNAPFFCVRPWVVSMQFYGANDMTLGEFLTKFCFNKDYACPSSNCELPMLEHSRKLVCARICIEVTTQVVVPSSSSGSLNDSSDDIFGWHYCPSCKASSPLVPIDDKVWHLSLGKMLDYLSHSSFSLGCVSSPGASTSCQHCFFHEHHHFFSYANYVTSFKVTMIRPFDVHFSSVVCRIDPSFISLQSIIDNISRTADYANDIKIKAENEVNKNRDMISHLNGTTLSSLEDLFNKTSSIIQERSKVVEELKGVEEDPIPNNHPLAIKGKESEMIIREAAYNLLNTWHTESATLVALARTLKKNADENGQPPPLCELVLDKVIDPFPSCLHLGIPLPLRVPVVVRDLQDARGGIKPDIGSIVAYALASIDYEEGRRKAREAAGGEEQPMNLNATSIDKDENIVSAQHFDCEFSDSQTSYYVKAYYSERFRLLRRLLLPDGESAFIRSLSESKIWTPQGGKSGSFFFRTCDDRFVIKSMSRFEVQSFVKFAPNYLDYLKTAVTEKKLTALCKVYGVFRVCYKFKNGTQAKIDILIMEYLFYKHEVNRVWDLKGSLRNRMASTGKIEENSSNLVLLDENLMKDLWNNQLYVLPHSKAALNQAISNDSHFLSSQHVMDYSLLVGVDAENGELVLGIVDYMRTYTLDKKLESWVKIVAIPGAHLPTILSPQMYCNRFAEAIDSYFPVVPDQWTGLGSVVSY